ncbi:MAG: hypothetical protein E7317_05295 [Clostridiales bacterium]|nr:hypothetical protein [Clostridiales bacterium]
MNKEKAVPLVTQQEPQVGGEMASSLPTPIVTHQGAVVNHSDVTNRLPKDVRQLRDLGERRHIPAMDLVELVRTIYPKFDRFLLSRCSHGEENGVMLRPDALKALLLHFAEDRLKPRADRRKRPNRCQCRLTDVLYERVRKRIQERGQTMQDYLEGLILRDLMEAHDG